MINWFNASGLLRHYLMLLLSAQFVLCNYNDYV